MYDFKTGNTITNPLEGVTHFYASPYDMASIWTLLSIGKKVNGNVEVEAVLHGPNELPIIIVPISILNLGRCIIRINDDLSGGKISTGKQSIYFRFSEIDHAICITGVH
jgi:hypothetical protein